MCENWELPRAEEKQRQSHRDSQTGIMSGLALPGRTNTLYGNWQCKLLSIDFQIGQHRQHVQGVVPTVEWECENCLLVAAKKMSYNTLILKKLFFSRKFPRWSFSFSHFFMLRGIKGNMLLAFCALSGVWYNQNLNWSNLQFCVMLQKCNQAWRTR